MHEIEALAGAFMIVRKKRGEVKCGRRLFFYGEDLDFCYMLKQKGWKIYYVPEFSVLHYKGVSGGLKKVSKDITTAIAKLKYGPLKHVLTQCGFSTKNTMKKNIRGLLPVLVYFGISLKQLIS